MSLSRRLVARYFSESHDQLVIGGCRASDLADRFDTPLYVYDAAILRERARAVREALGEAVTILFALKANPSAAIVQTLCRAGTGGEVASAGEILVALHAGLSGEQLQFAGPGKHGADLSLGVTHGVLFNVESEAELAAIDDEAKRAGRLARVALRVNPPASMTKSRMRMAGGSAKFGIDADAVDEVAGRAEALGSVRLEGLHTYAGTQTFDAEAWLDNARFLVNTAHRVEGALGRPLASLNFGGGFGVPTFEKDGEFDLEGAGRGLRELIAEDGAKDRRYYVELGRYLAAPAGVYLTRVTYVKRSRGKQHAILDGGMHQHAAAAGMGTAFRKPFPMVRAGALRAQAAGDDEVDCQLGGPLCTPADAFPTDPTLGALDPGELVAFLASGAYGLTFSNAMFLSHPLPAEVLVDGGQARLIRRRGEPADALRGQELVET